MKLLVDAETMCFGATMSNVSSMKEKVDAATSVAERQARQRVRRHHE